ncbi:MAG TPA: hypothetical protein VGM83_05785 [Devosiaceae bacterium]|jgi:hypothetical protein
MTQTKTIIVVRSAHPGDHIETEVLNNVRDDINRRLSATGAPAVVLIEPHGVAIDIHSVHDAD